MATMRSWKFSKSLSSVMFFGKGSSVLIPGFDSFLLRDANSTVSRLKWGTVTVLPMNLCGPWRTPPDTSTYPPTENDQYKHLSNVSEMIALIILAIRIAAITQVSSPNSIIICYWWFIQNGGSLRNPCNSYTSWFCSKRFFKIVQLY